MKSSAVAIRVFGLTGGVASGKSSVGRIFRGAGLEVIDADEVARAVVRPGSDGLAAVKEAFGDEVLRADGSLDRGALGTRVFADGAERRRLNAILHPLIGMETAARVKQLQQHGVQLACYEAALLVENGLADAFRPLVVVALPVALQLQRLIARDGLSLAAAQQRILAQQPLADKVALADHVIDNSGDRAALQQCALRVLRDIRASQAAAATKGAD